MAAPATLKIIADATRSIRSRLVRASSGISASYGPPERWLKI